jgi:acyl-CoA synthetase (AMP-forming)/AMP-acid ligase II
MNTPPNARASIRDWLDNAPEGSARFLWGATAGVCLDNVLHGTSLGGRVAEAAGRSVLIATRDQFAAVLALIELDGIARRLIVCTPDLPSEHLITGSLIAADVALKRESDPGGAGGNIVDVKRQILEICHERPAPHKIPATIRFVPALEIAAAGRLARHA